METLLAEIQELGSKKGLNISWICDDHLPNKKWLVDVIATLDPDNKIFRKDYLAPPVRKRLRDVETITLPASLFEDLPPSTSKVKARRLKIMSGAFAAERASRLKEVRRTLDHEIIE